MTDNEIIKALECCSNDGGKDDCVTCPNLKSRENWDCKEDLPTVALDLINRQKAEIERLKAESNMADGYEDALVERTKSEAIKEFAERLKERTATFYSAVGIREEADNLVKEMVGDAK